MDNVGIVVEDLRATVDFFAELGFVLEGEMSVAGQWVDRVVGLDGVRNDVAMMRAPDGQGRLELMKFVVPKANTGETKAPVNALGIRRIMFAVKGLDEVAVRLQKLGAHFIGEVVQFADINGRGHRLCYLRGPEGIIVALAEQIGVGSSKEETESPTSALQRMDNVLIVVDDLEAAKSFFGSLLTFFSVLK